MQPFPTAFWKKTAEPVIEEVSCFTPVNSEDINGDGVYILQDSPLKPDNTQNAIALGDLAVGLHKDFKESELVSSPSSDPQRGFPMAHANRDGGFKTTNVNYRGAFTRNIDGTGENNFRGWYDFVEEAGLGSGSGSEKELVNFVLRNYLNIWRSNSAHKTNPITTTISEDCKTATVKCYFQKDAAQKLAELGDDVHLLSAADRELAEDVDWWSAYSPEIRDFVENRGFNGFNGGADLQDEPDLIHYFYRQRAKVSIRFKADNLTIKIKGLGTDHQRFDRDQNGNYPNGKNDNGPNEDNLAFKASQARNEFNRTALDSGIGDLQSCEIFLNRDKQIKCIAPMLGYWRDGVDSPYDGYINIFKGPVRIFDYVDGAYSDQGSNKPVYDDNGDYLSGNPIHGFGYISDAQYSAGYADGESVFSPYGAGYTKSYAGFYNRNSDTTSDSPDYNSPYQYTKTFSGLSGNQTVDIFFDSVTELFNGGAYYEIELSYT
tara:strand:- start:918 stop:2384 length:1467 start_codon:yes stop_codon:yes gene_type:complete